MNINSYMPVKIFSGEKCLFHSNEILKSFGNKCLIVTGKTSAVVSGALEDVFSVLKNNKIETYIFNEIDQNPQTLTCKKAGDLARFYNVDFVFGIGGGSVLDAAKAIAIYSENPEMSHADIYNRQIPAKHKPVILLGTTAGTGSEVTGVSVLTNSDTKLKKSISGADCYAEISFCDYNYTKSANTETRISTALDAFAHAIESYFSSSGNELSDIYSINALKILARYLLNKNFFKLTDFDFENLYIASLYAGLAINISGTCFPHSMGYYLTECHNVAHGKACAVFIPHYIAKAKKYCPEKFETIFNIMNCTFDEIVFAINSLLNLNLKFSETEAKEVAMRWKNGLKNFDRSPGGFDYIEAENLLISIIS